MSADGWTRAADRWVGNPMALDSKRARLDETNGRTEVTGSIICGVDGTKSAARAVDVARELGAQHGPAARVRPGRPLGYSGGETAAIADRLEELSAGDDWLIEVGHPVDRLVAAAADDRVRLIVVGSHGPRSSLLGSVSAELSRRASCPVVVVPPGSEGERRGVRSGHGFRRRHRALGARRKQWHRLRRRYPALRPGRAGKSRSKEVLMLDETRCCAGRRRAAPVAVTDPNYSDFHGEEDGARRRRGM